LLAELLRTRMERFSLSYLFLGYELGRLIRSRR
jgi:hypothetical protein